jgi:hypothetical protein
VQVETTNLLLKPPGTQRLNLKSDESLSNCAFMVQLSPLHQGGPRHCAGGHPLPRVQPRHGQVLPQQDLVAGKLVQVEQMKPMLKAPGTKRGNNDKVCETTSKLCET